MELAMEQIGTRFDNSFFVKIYFFDNFKFFLYYIIFIINI